MAEFALLVTIMAPLLFAIPMIGKLIDVRQTAVQASRYTAWETTVGVAPGAGNAVRGRFFTDPASPIVTGAGSCRGCAYPYRPEVGTISASIPVSSRTSRSTASTGSSFASM